MSARCWNAGPRLVGVALLALVISPATAPFSTCELDKLFGSPTTHDYAVLGSKTATDDKLPTLDGLHDLRLLTPTSFARPTVPLVWARTGRAVSPPLRI